MALINNQTFGFTKTWLVCALEIVHKENDIFRTSKMREARNKFIVGSNVLKSIKEWLLATNIIQKTKEKGCYELTNFGLSLKNNDAFLENASSWWSIHLAICFSENKNGIDAKNEPYVSLFNSLDSVSKSWVRYDEIQKNIINKFEDTYAKGSLEPAFEGVSKVFKKDQPLAEIGLIESQSGFSKIRLGSPKLTDEIIIHCLAMARNCIFSSRVTVDFDELVKNNVNGKICLSPFELKSHIRRFASNNKYSDYIGYSENANLNSINFGERLQSNKTLIELLQSKQDIWG